MDRRDEIWRDFALTRRVESPAAASMATPKLDAADFVSEERLQNGLLALSLSRQARRRPAARHGSIALSGSQTNSFTVQGGLLLAGSNLRSRGLHEIGRIGRNMRASVSVRPLLGILAERTGLIAKKGSPRLCWPSAWCG